MLFIEKELLFDFSCVSNKTRTACIFAIYFIEIISAFVHV